MATNKNKLIAAAAQARWAEGPMPGGASWQRLAEYTLAAKVFVADRAALKTIRPFTVAGLLPKAFRLSFLKSRR
jgi:cytidine deaminase